jgi:hypothetical protein
MIERYFFWMIELIFFSVPLHGLVRTPHTLTHTLVRTPHTLTHTCTTSQPDCFMRLADHYIHLRALDHTYTTPHHTFEMLGASIYTDSRPKLLSRARAICRTHRTRGVSESCVERQRRQERRPFSSFVVYAYFERPGRRCESVFTRA